MSSIMSVTFLFDSRGKGLKVIVNRPHISSFYSFRRETAANMVRAGVRTGQLLDQESGNLMGLQSMTIRSTKEVSCDAPEAAERA